jgi:zona occludens toxin (predicted ATPase)
MLEDVDKDLGGEVILTKYTMTDEGRSVVRLREVEYLVQVFTRSSSAHREPPKENKRL